MTDQPKNGAGSNSSNDSGSSNDNSNLEKNPNDWTTGEEAMTGAQKSYLKTLCEQAGVDFDDSLSKADASKKIDELQDKTGRGQSS